MKAQVLEAFNTPYNYREIPEPPPPKGQDITLRVDAASYCHTDAVFASGAMWQDLPRVGSHEFAGTILALGPDVSPSLGLAAGTKIGVPGRAFHSCGECYECVHNDGDPEGYGVWCTKAMNLGLSIDGGFQEICTADSRQVVPIPAGLDAINTAPLMCAGLTIWNALETTGIKMEVGGGEGKSVAISGAGGGLGHLGVQFAAKLGCHVVAIDVGQKALSFLKNVVKDLGSLGSKVTIVDALSQPAGDVRLAIFGKPELGREEEKGVDAVLILPEAQDAYEYGMKLVRSHGIAITVSFPKDGFLIQPRDLVFRHITLKGVLIGRQRQLKAMLEFAVKNGVRAKLKAYPLDKLNELVEDYHQGTSGKLVVDMGTGA